MARAKTSSKPPQSESAADPDDDDPSSDPIMIPRVCANCTGWAPLGNDPVLGECMPSRRARMSPLVTTDLGTCSRFTSLFPEGA